MNPKQKIFDIHHSEVELRKILDQNLDGSSVTPDKALASIIEFYESYKTEIEIEDMDDDMLLAQYGVYNWNEEGERFMLNFTRQILDPEEEEYYQIRLTLHFNVQDIGEISSVSLWSGDQSSVKEWEKVVIQTEGFKKALRAKPTNLKIELSKT